MNCRTCVECGEALRHGIMDTETGNSYCDLYQCAANYMDSAEFDRKRREGDFIDWRIAK